MANPVPFFINRIFKKEGPPIHLIWFVTDRCNLRCSHCFYSRQVSGKSEELCFDEIRKTVDNLSPLLSVTLTGGEPFLRTDLSSIAKLVFKKTSNIVLYSNGFNTDTIVATSERILMDSPDGTIFLGISIDGFKEVHDRYRCKEGSYQRAMETLKQLVKLKNKYHNLNLGVGITLHRGNQSTVLEIRNDIHAKFGINAGITLIRGCPQCAELKDIDPASYTRAVDALVNEKKKVHYTSLVQRIIATREVLGQKLARDTYMKGSRSYDCYGGFLMAVLYANGDVYPCEMLKDSCLGNLRDFDFDINQIWKTTKARKTRELIRSRTCFCTYECQYTCNTLYNIRFAPVFMRDIAQYAVRQWFQSPRRHNE